MDLIAGLDGSWAGLIQRVSDQTLSRCFDCAKCTGGCPVAADMEYGPHRIMQMVRFGLKHQVLSSGDIWLCAGCETCGTRCPNEIDIAQIMDALRRASLAQRAENPASEVADFHRLFLLLVGAFGRMHEVSLLALYKLRTRDFLGDLDAGSQLFLKRKIPIMPERIKGTREIRNVLGQKRG
jgi:heterodisulfide reductase subunit C